VEVGVIKLAGDPLFFATNQTDRPYRTIYDFHWVVMFGFAAGRRQAKLPRYVHHRTAKLVEPLH
jgi:hypothetical protein